MPQGADITILDGQATPVSRTFALLSAAAGYGGVAEFVYKKGNFASGWPALTISAVKSKLKRKSTGKLVYPVVITDANGQAVVQAVAIGHFDLQFDANFPEDQKADALAFFVNAQSNSIIKSAMRDGTPVT